MYDRKFVLLRVVLPATLIVASLIRISVISFFYAILALICPLVPRATPYVVPWATKKYLQMVLAVGLSCALGQLVFHVTLLSAPPYGHEFVDCTYYEKLIRQFGFQRLDLANGWQLIRLILPELSVSIMAMYTYVKVVLKKPPIPPLSHMLLNTMMSSPIALAAQQVHELMDEEANPTKNLADFFKRHNLQGYKQQLFDILTIFLIGMVGMLQPSFISAVYFAIFMGLTSWWATNHRIGETLLIRVKLFVLVYTGLHLVLLYLYQFPFFQEFCTPKSFGARFLGFSALIQSQCENVRIVYFSEDNRWPSYFSPLLLMTLYGMIAAEMRDVLIFKAKKVTIEETEERVTQDTATLGILSSGKFVASGGFSPDPTTSTYDSAKPQSILESPKHVAIEIEQQPNDDNKGNEEELGAAEDFTLTHRSLGVRRHGTIGRSAGGLAAFASKTGPLTTLYSFVNQHCYVMALMMMMAWSITYHSWSTFVLLLIACVAWMVPNPRLFCLRLSPFIVAYANFLIVVQFIYGFDLTESELPDEKPLILRQLGFEKPRKAPPCLTIILKTFYSIMFWVTLRQYLQERDAHSCKDIKLGAVEAPFSIAFITSHSGIARTEAPQGEKEIPKLGLNLIPMADSNRLQRFGKCLRETLTSYWIFISAAILLVVSLREPVVAYRIIYMTFFLGFVTIFQISFYWWRRILYTYYMMMIVYCMIVLTFIYTYQFHGIPELWHNGTGLSYDVLESVGLEKYSSAELFLRLLTPISFLIITIIQLNYFHKDLLILTEKLYSKISPRYLKYPTLESVVVTNVAVAKTLQNSIPVGNNHTSVKDDQIAEDINDIQQSSATDTLEEHTSQSQLPTVETDEKTDKPESIASQKKTGIFAKINKKDYLAYAEKVYKIFNRYKNIVATLVWRFLEIHIAKMINSTMMAISIFEVSALNLPYVIVVSIALPLERFHTHLSHFTAVWTSIVIIAKMLYQMKFVKEAELMVTCETFYSYNISGFTNTGYSIHNHAVNSTSWGGLSKNPSISRYLKGYLVLLMLLTLQCLVKMRQKYVRVTENLEEPPRGILIPNISRLDADKGIPHCILYFINFFFYRFGLEICFMSSIAVMGMRMDIMAVLYGLWLMALMSMKRNKVAKVWKYYLAYLAVALPIQYLSALGIPPTTCAAYPWTKDGTNVNFVEWMFLPEFTYPPNPIKLGGDFIQLLFASCQFYVFQVESSQDYKDYPGGQNCEMILKSIPVEELLAEENPVPDFITSTKSYLDLLKVGLFMYTYWATLAFVFIAGVSRVTLFAMGYVVGCFLFLWVGNELFLRPLSFASRLWNFLIAYCVIVIFIKCALQVVGCVYVTQLFRNYCWVLQLFGIACLKTGMNPRLLLASDPLIAAQCNVPTEEAGILYDGICFFFLILQRRIVASYYFRHVIAEFRAQQVFASRGAELINDITMKEIAKQQEREQEIVSKIKKKMEKIRQSQKGPESKVKSKMKGNRKRRNRAHLPPIIRSTSTALMSRELLIRAESVRINRKRSISCEISPVKFPPEHQDSFGTESETTSFAESESLRKSSMATALHRTHSSFRSVTSTVSPAVDNYFDVDMLSPSQAEFGEFSNEKKRLSTDLLTPSLIRSKGLDFVKGHMRAAAPLAAFDLPSPTYRVLPTGKFVLAQSGFEICKFDNNSAPCHLVGPDLLPSPLSTGFIPFLTAPDTTAAHPATVKQPPIRPISTAELPVERKRSIYRRPTELGSQRPLLRISKTPERPAIRPSLSRSKSSVSHRQRPSFDHSISPSASPLSSAPSGDYLTIEDGGSDEEELELGGNSAYVVPEAEEDRRKGLGPLQLLNVAFKKGAIKEAVKDAKDIEEQHLMLEKEMTDVEGRANQKAIRKRLKRTQPAAKPLADFEEETFEEEHISTDVVGRHYRRGSDHSGDSPLGRRKGSAGPELRRRFSVAARQESVDLGDEMPLRPHSTPPPISPLEEVVEPTEIEVEITEETEAEEDQMEEGQTATSDKGEPEKQSILSMVMDRVRNGVMFVSLFVTGVIESMITWLLKVSRDYRYVAHVLAAEKKTQKDEFLTEIRGKSRTNLDSLALNPQLPRVSSDFSTATDKKADSAKEISLSRSHTRSESRRPSSVDTTTAKSIPLKYPISTFPDDEAEQFEKTKNMFIRLFIAAYYVLISRSELFCYLMMVLNHMNAASLLSMILPLMAFLWGTLSVPRPSRLFWISVITYTEAMVVIKYLFQFGFFPWNKIYPIPMDPFWPPRILGIEKKEKYAGWDLALLMVLFFHRSILKTMGLWKDTPSEKENEGGSTRRSSKSGVSEKSKKPEAEGSSLMPADADVAAAEKVLEELVTKSAGTGMISAEEFERLIFLQRKRIKKGMLTYIVSFINFFRTLLNPEYRYSIDVYAPMFLCDFICFLIVVFGYSAFGTDQGAGGVESFFQEDKIPGPFLVMLIVQFGLIIIDRALFLRKFLFGKLAYQLGLVGFIHVWLFLILPAVTDKPFDKNLPAKLWYLTKCVYFCLSAWQIRSGYPTRILGNFLTKKYNYINMLLFKGFMIVPFLFELRALMDWIWTDTSMSLSDWLKLEDIYANIYQIKCQRKSEEDYPTPRGVKRRPLVKYGFGGSMLIFCIMLIWFPLALFSLANTVGIRNLPADCTVKLTIGQYQPLFQMSAQQQFLKPISYNEYRAMETKHITSKVALSYMADYTANDVVKASLPGNSTTLWAISPPSKSQLISDLDNNDTVVEMKFEWSFTRPPEANLPPVVVGSENVLILTEGHRVRQELVEMLSGRRQTPIKVEKLFPPYVKIPAKGKAGPSVFMLMEKFKENVNESFVDVTMRLESGPYQSTNTTVEWWQLKMIDPGDYKTEKENLEIIGFADKQFPSNPMLNWVLGNGIIGVYSALVLFVGKFVRVLITGAMYKIMFEELPNVDRILQLCLDIFLVRESGELELEEDLFAKLIFLYRSPATLIKWTKEKNK